MSLLSAPDRIEQAGSVEKAAETRRLALRMAVLAQVHVTTNQFHSATKQFERADKLWQVETRLAEASGNQQRGGTQNEIERISSETSAIAAELRRFQTYAQLQSAYGKMQSTIGADPVAEPAAPKDAASQGPGPANSAMAWFGKTISDGFKALMGTSRE